MIPGTSHPPQRVDFRTADPLTARQFMHETFGGRLLMTRHRDSTWQLAVTRIDAGVFSFSDFTLPAELVFTAGESEAVTFNTMIDGHVEYDRAGSTGRYARGDAVIGNAPGAGFVSRTYNARMRSVTLPRYLLAAAAGTALDGPDIPLRFLVARPPGAGALGHWKDTTAYVDRMLASPEASSSPLVIGAAARLLAATALITFPNGAPIPEGRRDRRDGSAATLRRATAFMDEHALEDLSLADIAAAAFVTPRAVQLAFRRHLDTTPVAYLRRVRLERVRAELLAAGPDGGQTVTAIAARWGFANLSRFTAYYRQAYGITPGRTLRHGRPEPVRTSPSA